MATPSKVKYLFLELTCISASKSEFDRAMKGAKRANKRIVNKLVRKFNEQLYSHLALHLWNPYHYYYTDKHIILVHSGTEYFLKYERD